MAKTDCYMVSEQDWVEDHTFEERIWCSEKTIKLSSSEPKTLTEVSILIFLLIIQLDADPVERGK